MNLQEMAQQPPVPVDGAAQPPAQQAAMQAASPEMQEQFDVLLGSCRQIIGGTSEEWLSALQVDPVISAVKMGTTVLRTVASQYEEAGQPFDPVVMIHAGLTLVKDIAGIANEAGIVPDEQLEQYIRNVTQLSIAEYMRRDADAGLMPKKGDKK